jgi:hypothetical protein
LYIVCAVTGHEKSKAATTATTATIRMDHLERVVFASECGDALEIGGTRRLLPRIFSGTAYIAQILAIIWKVRTQDCTRFDHARQRSLELLAGNSRRRGVHSPDNG